MAIEKFVIDKNSTLPSIQDQIVDDDGQPFDLTGFQVAFRMRDHKSSTLTVDASATIVTPSTGVVRYDWYAQDTVTTGHYKAWWHCVKAGFIMDRPEEEFDVFVDEHAPGFPVRTGMIAEYVRGYIPETIRTMTQHAENNFDDEVLQRHIDIVKQRLFGTVVATANEETTYSPVVLDYVAKQVVLRLIPAGFDFWNNQQITRTLMGTQEVEAYADRAANLLKLRDLILGELADVTLIFTDGVWSLGRARRIKSLPAISNRNVVALTPNPQNYHSMATNCWPGVNIADNWIITDWGV